MPKGDKATKDYSKLFQYIQLINDIIFLSFNKFLMANNNFNGSIHNSAIILMNIWICFVESSLNFNTTKF